MLALQFQTPPAAIITRRQRTQVLCIAAVPQQSGCAWARACYQVCSQILVRVERLQVAVSPPEHCAMTRAQVPHYISGLIGGFRDMEHNGNLPIARTWAPNPTIPLRPQDVLICAWGLARSRL